MTIAVAGLVLEADPRAMLRYFDSFEAPARPMFALFCERCAMFCAVKMHDCRCCDNIGKTFSGSKRIRISGSPHGRIPVDVAITALRLAA